MDTAGFFVGDTWAKAALVRRLPVYGSNKYVKM